MLCVNSENFALITSILRLSWPKSLINNFEYADAELGWQYQRSPPTIQCLIEEALTGATRLERKDLHLVGASRTDTGVHAWGQV